jgi:hypothetical protein
MLDQDSGLKSPLNVSSFHRLHHLGQCSPLFVVKVLSALEN